MRSQREKQKVLDVAEVIHLDLDEINESLDTAARAYLERELTAYSNLKKSFSQSDAIEDEQAHMDAFVRGRKKMLGLAVKD